MHVSRGWNRVGRPNSGDRFRRCHRTLRRKVLLRRDVFGEEIIGQKIVFRRIDEHSGAENTCVVIRVLKLRSIHYISGPGRGSSRSSGARILKTQYLDETMILIWDWVSLYLLLIVAAFSAVFVVLLISIHFSFIFNYGLRRCFPGAHDEVASVLGATWHILVRHR